MFNTTTMKTKERIIAIYLEKEGHDEIGDRCIDLDVYKEVVVDSIESGVELIKEKDPNGLGIVMEQTFGKYGQWEDSISHSVDNGEIYDTITY